MRNSQLRGRTAAAVVLGLVTAFAAAPSFGRPGDRIGRYPLTIATTDGVVGVSAPALAMDQASGFVAVWSSDEGDDSRVLLRRFAANGTPLGDAITVDSASDTTHDIKMSADVAMAGDGSVVVAWTVCEFPCFGQALFVRRFAASGAPIGDRVDVWDDVSQLTGSFSVATAADGRFA